MSLLQLTGSAATDAVRQTMAFASDRQKIFADNIANIDTPGYRMRDLSTVDFRETLSKAISRAHKSNPGTPRLDLGDLNRVDEGSSSRGPDAAKLRSIIFHDDNDRSVEKLLTAMTQNAILQSQALGALRSQNSLLQAIIAENVSK